MNTKSTRRSRRAMVPGLDQLESRQLLSTLPTPVYGPIVKPVPGAAVVERTPSGHRGPTTAASTLPPLSVTGLHIVPSSTVAGSALIATAEIAANDIWAVGFTNSSTGIHPLVEHFNETSWSIVASPNATTRANFQSGVTALSTGTVVAVGTAIEPNTGNTNGLILSD